MFVHSENLVRRSSSLEFWRGTGFSKLSVSWIFSSTYVTTLGVRRGTCQAKCRFFPYVSVCSVRVNYELQLTSLFEWQKPCQEVKDCKPRASSAFRDTQPTARILCVRAFAYASGSFALADRPVVPSCSSESPSGALSGRMREGGGSALLASNWLQHNPRAHVSVLFGQKTVPVTTFLSLFHHQPHHGCVLTAKAHAPYGR